MDEVKARARKVPTKAKTHFEGFTEFIREQGVVGLAIGLILGIQIKAVVDQVVASFINPVLGLVFPGDGTLSEKVFTLSVGDRKAIFAYGAVISVLISLITVALLIYFAVKALKLDKLHKRKD